MYERRQKTDELLSCFSFMFFFFSFVFKLISFLCVLFLQYLQIAKRLPSYGSIKFSNATVDYPKGNTLANILIGNKELCIQTMNNNEKCQETKFRITRMRCWRFSTNYNVRFDAPFKILF